MKLVWSSRARRSAETAVDYMAQDRPEAALSWLDGLVARLELLRDFPEQGRMVPEWSSASVREVYYSPLRVIYEVFPDRVEILLLHHQRQDMPAE